MEEKLKQIIAENPWMVSNLLPFGWLVGKIENTHESGMEVVVPKNAGYLVVPVALLKGFSSPCLYLEVGDGFEVTVRSVEDNDRNTSWEPVTTCGRQENWGFDDFFEKIVECTPTQFGEGETPEEAVKSFLENSVSGVLTINGEQRTLAPCAPVDVPQEDNLDDDSPLVDLESGVVYFEEEWDITPEEQEERDQALYDQYLEQLKEEEEEYQARLEYFAMNGDLD